MLGPKVGIASTMQPTPVTSCVGLQVVLHAGFNVPAINRNHPFKPTSLVEMLSPYHIPRQPSTDMPTTFSWSSGSGSGTTTHNPILQLPAPPTEADTDTTSDEQHAPTVERVRALNAANTNSTAQAQQLQEVAMQALAVQNPLVLQQQQQQQRYQEAACRVPDSWDDMDVESVVMPSPAMTTDIPPSIPASQVDEQVRQ